MREDWIEVSFSEVLDIISGKNQKNVVSSNGKYPIYGSGGEIGRASSYLCHEGTTIIGRKGTINNPIYVREKFWNVDTAFGLSPFSALNKRYLFFFARGFNFARLDKSTTIPSLSKRDLLQILIPLAALPEQRAIVAKIEELFSELDKGEEDLKKAQEQLKIYRQAVLKKAFEGNWKEISLGELGTWGSGGTPSRSNPDYFNGTIPWVKTGELGSKYITTAEEKITEEAIKNSSAKLFPSNSVAIAMYGATIGKTSIFKASLSTNQACAVVQPNDSIDTEYLYYLLTSMKRKFISLGKGGAQPNISQTLIKQQVVPLPDLISQKEIVQEIETRLSVCDSIEDSIHESLNKSKALRQSILKKAFEGTLLPEEEIAACKAAPDYEPASVLLERIKAEKKKN